MVKLKICHGRKTQLVVSNQVVTNPCCGLAVIFCGFISLLIGRETINIPEIFSGVHGFTGMTVSCTVFPIKPEKILECLLFCDQSHAVEKVMLVGSHWWFLIRIFFVAEKPAPNK